MTRTSAEFWSASLGRVFPDQLALRVRVLPPPGRGRIRQPASLCLLACVRGGRARADLSGLLVPFALRGMAALVLSLSVRGAPAASVGLRPESVYDTDVGHMLEPMMLQPPQPMVQEVPQGWGRNETDVNATAAQYSSETAHLLEPLLASQPASQHQAAQHRRNRLVTILLDHSASMAAAHQPWIAIGTRLVDAARRVSRAAVGLWQTVSKSRTLVNTEERRPGVTLHWENVS